MATDEADDIGKACTVCVILIIMLFLTVGVSHYILTFKPPMTRALLVDAMAQHMHRTMLFGAKPEKTNE